MEIMKKVYYTNLNIVSLFKHFLVEVDNEQYEVKISHTVTMIGGFGTVQDLLYDKMEKILGNNDFFLIPSVMETEMIAKQEDRMKHPEKYPMSCDCSVNPWGAKCDRCGGSRYD
jgi:hypothetical protein